MIACLAVSTAAMSGEVSMEPVGGVGNEITVDPGTTVVIEILIEGIAPEPIRAVQMIVPRSPEGTGTGSVSYIGGTALVDSDREDFIFADVSSVDAINEVNPDRVIFLAAASTIDDAVLVTDQVYFANFSVEVSEDASGVFTFDFIDIGTGSVLTTPTLPPGPIPFDALSAVIHTGPPPPPPFIVHEDAEDAATAPCSGYVDPRRESTNGTDVNQGLMSADILFSEAVFGDDSGNPVTTANFTLTDCDGAAGPAVTEVAMIGGDPAYIRVSWDGVLALQKWTTLQATVWNDAGIPILNQGDLGEDVNEPDRLDFANLPADIDQNERVQPLDLLRMRQRLLGSCSPACPDCGGRDEFYFDIDRNGNVQALDLLRWRQLWFGSSIATQVWQGAQTTCDRP